MRRLVLLLSVALLAAGVGPSPAPAKAPAKAKLRCAKGTKVHRDAQRRLIACVRAAAPTEAALVAGLRRAASAGLPARARKGRGPRVRAGEVEQLARRVADVSKPLPGLLQRAFFDHPGQPTSRTSNPRDGSETLVWDKQDASTEIWRRYAEADPPKVGNDSEMRTRVRDQGAGGRSMGLAQDTRLDRCPSAAGDAAGTFVYGVTIGQATASGGQRTWSEVVVRFESPLTGHVGVDAKAEWFDLALRGSMELRGWVEDAKTGKLVKHLPTRTFRLAYAAKHVPVHGDVGSLARQLVAAARLRGPHGTRATSQDELDAASRLLDGATIALTMMQERFQEGDKRWYDQRSCAKLAVSSSPAKLRKGDTATWDVEVQAADGTPVGATSPWTVRSACDGTLTASQVDGARGHFEVSGGDWRADPDHHACLNGELTSPAGRPPLLQHPIYAADPPKGYRFTIHVDYTKNMGADIAGTELHADGTVSDEPDDRSTEGSGQWSATEWDGTLTNTCGQDMQRTRTVGGPAVAGAEIHADGTVTVALTAAERPLDFSWIVTVPVTGGSETITASQPFCGEPGLAKTQAVVTVKSEPLER